MNQETLIILLAFGSISVMVYFVSMLLFKGGGDDKLRSRLQGKVRGDLGRQEGRRLGHELLKQLRELAAKPFMPSSREKQSSLQKELARAGVYSPAALRTVQGSKVHRYRAGPDRRIRGGDVSGEHVAVAGGSRSFGICRSDRLAEDEGQGQSEATGIRTAGRAGPDGGLRRGGNDRRLGDAAGRRGIGAGASGDQPGIRHRPHADPRRHAAAGSAA